MWNNNKQSLYLIAYLTDKDSYMPFLNVKMRTSYFPPTCIASYTSRVKVYKIIQVSVPTYKTY